MSKTDQPGIQGDILIIDDDASSLQTLSAILLEQGYGVRRARDARTALMIINNAPPALILLDVRMPEMDGFELCQILKADGKSCDIPILFLSALVETVDKIKGFEVGGVDFITKPFQVEEVLARVQTHLDLCGLRHQLKKQNEVLKAALKEQENAKSALKKANDELEERVKARTAKLEEANVGLKGEIAERTRMEKVLSESQHRLREEIEERKHREKELRHTQKKLEQQFKFDNMLSMLSTKFINSPFDRIDQKIDEGLGLITGQLGIERIALLQFSQDKSQLNLTHAHAIDSRQWTPIFRVSGRLPWFSESLRRGKTLRISSIVDMPKEAAAEKRYAKEQGYKSSLTIPMKVDEQIIGAVSYSSMTRERNWSDELVQQFNLVSEIFANILDRKQKEQSLQSSFFEIKHLKDRLQQENVYLKEEIRLEHRHGEIVGKSPAINYVLRQGELVAKTNSTILIQGETGTGKELLARAIHNLSPRKERAMVTVNCAALPPGLIESELFGREKGAYTGALAKQAGRFEIADGSTIFLDEVGELPPELQTKLLRVLQEGEFQRLGSSKTVKVDVRVIAASNRNLSKAVSDGSFREDLYYRLHVFPIIIPPLRERQEDIPLLVWAFVKEFEKTMGKRISTIQQSKMEEMMRYAWPGNIRELRNVVEQAMIVTKDTMLNLRAPETTAPEKIHDLSLETFERTHIKAVLDKTGWRVKGNNGAAEILGLHPATLFSKMKKLGIKRTYG